MSSGSQPTSPLCVTVIVPVFEDLERLTTCLRCLAAQDYPADLIEVTVIDNASRTDLRSALPPGDARFRLIREEQRGSYAARNAGLRAGYGDVVAFTDADCRPRPNWLRTAVAALAVPEAPDAVGGSIRLFFRDGAEPRTGPELYESAHEFDQKAFIEWGRFAATANLVVRRSTIELVGPFNAELQSGGDDDWGHRLHDAGGRLRYCEEAIVDHPARASWRELTQKTVRVARGNAQLSAGQPLVADARHVWEEITSGLRVWVAVWRRAWPRTATQKLKYATAYSWVSCLTWVSRVRWRLFPVRT